MKVHIPHVYGLGLSPVSVLCWRDHIVFKGPFRESFGEGAVIDLAHGVHKGDESIVKWVRFSSFFV